MESSSRGFVEAWTLSDVQQWLAEQPALSRYAKELEGTTGKELLCLDDEMLAEVGVSSRLHRKQLLNRRDELVEAEKQAKSSYIPAAGVHRTPLPSTPSWGRQTSGLQKTLSFSTHSLTRTITLPAEAPGPTKLQPAPAAELHMIVLRPEGLVMEVTHSTSPEIKSMLAKLTACYRNIERAFYGQDNCRSLVGCAAQVQSEIMGDQATAKQHGLLLAFLRLLSELEDFTSEFSIRGWLNRLKLTGSTLLECQRLHGLLVELVTDFNLPLHLEPHTDYDDAAGTLKARLNESEPHDPWLSTELDPNLAQRLIPLLDQQPSSQLSASVAAEIAYCAATEGLGPHSIIRHAQLRVFWWQCFRMVEEVPWETFWTSFPRTLDPVHAAELGKIFVSKANRQQFQRTVSRRTQQAVTSVELDFIFPPGCSLERQCEFLLRSTSMMSRLSNLSWGGRSIPRSPSSPIPTFDNQFTGCSGTGCNMGSPVVGVDEFLEHLINELSNPEDACQILHVVGPPGFGKLTLVNSVVGQMLQAGFWEFSECIDLTACTSGAACIFAFLSACGVPADTPDLAALLAWLTRNVDLSFGLVVLCPNDLPKAVEDQLRFLLGRICKTTGNARILIISEHQFPMQRPGYDDNAFNESTFNIFKMSSDAGMKLLHRLAPEVKQEQAQRLVRLCEGLPSALQLVAAAITSNNLDPEDLLDNPDLSDSGSETGKASFTGMIIRQVVGELEEDLLHAFLLLSIFPASFSTFAAAEVLGLAGNLFHCRSILRALVEARLLAPTTEHRWTLARAVRQSARGLTSELGLVHDTAKASLVAYYAAMLLKSFAITTAHAPMAASRLLDLSQASIFEVISWASTAPWSSLEAFAEIVWDCMRMLSPRMEPQQRLAFCWATHELAVKADNAVWRGRALYQVGLTFSDQGRWKEADLRMTEALAILEGELGADHVHLARVCNGLANVKYRLGMWDVVQDLFARAYDIQSTQLGPDHPELALTMSHSAGLLRAMNKLADAEIVYRTVLEMRERTLGLEHLEVAASLNHIAVLMKMMGRYEEAEQLYKRSIAIKEKCLGGAHPQVAVSLNNLSALFRKTGRMEEAEQLYRQALSICEEDLGPDHPQVASSYTNLAGLLRGQNRTEEALAFTQKALAIRIRALPSNHPDLAAVHLSLANLLRDLGQYEDAAMECKEAVIVLTKDSQAEDPNVATALCLQASLQLNLGQAPQAERLCRRALDIRTRLLGATHFETGLAMTALCDALCALERFSEAELNGKKALEIQDAANGSSSLQYAECLFSMAALHAAQQRWITAASNSQRCLEIREQQLPQGSNQIAEAQVQLAAIVQKQSDHARAEALLRRALSTREKVLGLQHPLTLATAASLESVAPGCKDVLARSKRPTKS